MKSIKLLASALMLAAATTASAQFVNSGSNTTATTPGGPRNVDLTGWQRVTVSFNPTKISYDYDDADPMKMTGFSVGYAKGFSIAKQVPLFLEAGINAQFAFKKLDREDLEDTGFDAPSTGGSNEYDIETKFTTMNLNIPVNLAYKFSLNNGKTSLVPYAGINFKFNIIAKKKLSLVDADDYLDNKNWSEDDFWDDWEDNDSNPKQSSNMFDKDEAGGKDNQWKRFQMGWQIGLGLYHNQYYVGVGYTKDFTELCKKTKVGYANISVGYCF